MGDDVYRLPSLTLRQGWAVFVGVLEDASRRGGVDGGVPGVEIHGAAEDDVAVWSGDLEGSEV